MEGRLQSACQISPGPRAQVYSDPFIPIYFFFFFLNKIPLSMWCMYKQAMTCVVKWQPLPSSALLEAKVHCREHHSSWVRFMGILLSSPPISL